MLVYSVVKVLVRCCLLGMYWDVFLSFGEVERKYIFRKLRMGHKRGARRTTVKKLGSIRANRKCENARIRIDDPIVKKEIIIYLISTIRKRVN